MKMKYGNVGVTCGGFFDWSTKVPPEVSRELDNEKEEPAMQISEKNTV